MRLTLSLAVCLGVATSASAGVLDDARSAGVLRVGHAGRLRPVQPAPAGRQLSRGRT